MADLRGYFSGVKDATDIQRQQQAMRLQQMAADREQRNFELEEQERDLAGKAMQATIPDRLNGEVVSADDKIAMQMENIAKSIVSVNPKASIDYMGKASDYRSKSINRIKDNLELKSARMEVQGEIASNVFDDASAKEAVAKMADEGFVVPERYRNYSPEAQEWWQRRALQSKAFRESTKLDIEQLKLQNTERDTESKIQKRVADTKMKERKELLTQDKITQGRKLSFQPPKEQKAEVRLLADQDERFADLDSTLQSAVVKDIYSVAGTYLKEDPKLDQAVALQRARRDVLGRIDEEGKYKVIADPQKSVPSLDQFLPAAMKANPGYTEEQIRAIYKDKYGSK
jgi:hypothetical protein